MMVNIVEMIRLGIEYDAMRAFKLADSDDLLVRPGDFNDKVVGILDFHFEKFLHMTAADQTDGMRAQRLDLLTALEDGALRVSTSVWSAQTVRDEIAKRRTLWEPHIQSSASDGPDPDGSGVL